MSRDRSKDPPKDTYLQFKPVKDWHPKRVWPDAPYGSYLWFKRVEDFHLTIGLWELTFKRTPCCAELRSDRRVAEILDALAATKKKSPRLN